MLKNEDIGYFAFCADEALNVKIKGMPVHRFFAPEGFLQFGLGTMRGEMLLKDQIVDMPIDMFLGLAEPIPEDDEKRHAPMEDFKNDVMAGKVTNWEIPILTLKENEDGIWKVVGHDGRHRGILLKSLGYNEMPVHISIPEGLMSEEYIPDILWCQNDRNVKREKDYYPFPIKETEFNRPYVVISDGKVVTDENVALCSIAEDCSLVKDGGTIYPAGCDSNNLKNYIGEVDGGDEAANKGWRGNAPSYCTNAKKNFAKYFVPNVAYRADNTMPASTLKEYLSKKQ